MKLVKLQKTFKLKGMDPRYPIVQGGMGAGISLFELASEVGKHGCIGTVSSAALDQFTARRLGIPRMGLVEATETEIRNTKAKAGIAAINIMVALVSSYERSVEGAVRGGVDMIISGAGLPMNLPSLVEKYAGKGHEVNLVPIVSSARALEIICKRWDRQGYRPDAVVLEGPKAGGHLGFNYQQVQKSGCNFLADYDLFKVLLPPVLDAAKKYPNDFGSLPVIVAGGIYTHDDIVYAISQGASAVQMATRFAATFESGASAAFKQALIDVKQHEIVIAGEDWGSSCGLPFRYMTISPLRQERDRLHPEQQRKQSCFCICTTLLGCAGIKKEYGGMACPEAYARRDEQCHGAGCASSKDLYTCGTEAHRIKKLMPVEELITELVG